MQSAKRLQAQAQKGFTLIELIITIVIIGILAAVAIPKFLNLSSDASTGVAQGVAGALASATSVNYAKQLTPAKGGVAIADCAAIQANLAALADVPTGTAVTAGATALTTTGTAGECVLKINGLPAAGVPFQAYGAPA